MIVEHWLDDESTTVLVRGQFEYHRKLFVGTPVKCCEIEGDTWEHCMAKYHEHMGWEPYVPVCVVEVSEAPTIIELEDLDDESAREPATDR